ncbi:ACT3-like protein [Mya arenaria]|uniref:ACT3-like protein n=1 Tax=Mya arenaria TaxID=6604 RepID=A0ABY7E2U1_MYAAR|nr:ACT3-like protein [Mya arenaria]
MTQQRDPLDRYINRGGHWEGTYLECAGEHAEWGDVLPCFHKDNWLSVLLEEFTVARMLADLQRSGCYTHWQEERYKRQRALQCVSSAMENLRSMEYFGIMDRPERSDILSLVPPPIKVKVIAAPERKNSVWIGGSILTSLSTFAQQWDRVTSWVNTTVCSFRISNGPLKLPLWCGRYKATPDREKLCYVAEDYKAEMSTASDFVTVSFQLSEGKSVTMDNEKLRCGEVLFNPSLTGFPERLQKELTSHVPPPIKVNVIAAPERKNSVWIGGSILTSLSTFAQQWRLVNG